MHRIVFKKLETKHIGNAGTNSKSINGNSHSLFICQLLGPRQSMCLEMRSGWTTGFLVVGSDESQHHLGICERSSASLPPKSHFSGFWQKRHGSLLLYHGHTSKPMLLASKSLGPHSQVLVYISKSTLASRLSPP